MPRIVPLQLLKCLKVLLDDNGGILSESEVKRIAGLMTKYSKKLVSKCIYVQILKCTKTELLGEFMGAGGWSLTHLWLNDAIRAMNWPLVQEILELLLLCPVDVDRLKSNSAPKLVKGLCKDGGNEGVRILAVKLVEQWLKVVTSDTVAPRLNTSTILPSIMTQTTNSHSNEEAGTLSSFDSRKQKKKSNSPEVEDPLANVGEEPPASYSLTPAQKKATESGLIYKIVVKDGQQVFAKIENKSKVNSSEISEKIDNYEESKTKISDEINSQKAFDLCDNYITDKINNETDTKAKHSIPKKTSSSEDENMNFEDKKLDNSFLYADEEKQTTLVKKYQQTEEKMKQELKENQEFHSNTRKDGKLNLSNKDKKSIDIDRKSSSSSSHRTSSSASHKSSSKSSSSSNKLPTSSSSHRNSTNGKQPSLSCNREKDKDKDFHSSYGNLSNKEKLSKDSKYKSSSGKSLRPNSKERHRDKEKEKKIFPFSRNLENKDKEISTIPADKETTKITSLSLEKFGRIPKKQKEDDSNSTTKSSSITIPSKKASMSIEIRRDSEKAKTVKTYKSQFRSHGLTEEAPPPPSRKGLKKPNSVSLPGTAIPATLSLKKSSPPPNNNNIVSRDSTIEKKSKIDINSFTVPNEKPGAIKLIAPKPKIQTLVETNIFSDALSAATGPKKEARKRKRINATLSANKDAVSSPISPDASKVAPLKFYQDTLDENRDEVKNAEISADSSGTRSEQEKDTDCTEDDDDIPLKKVKDDIEEKVRREMNTALCADSNTSEHSNANITSEPNKTVDELIEVDPEAPKKPGPGCGPNGPPGVLMLHRRKGPKKKLMWRPQDQLEQIRYFDLDETERVNVTKNFIDMKNLERFSERDAINMSRRGFNHEDNMEAQIPWKSLVLIDDVPPQPEGNNSKERKVQADREQTTLRALYFSNAMIPDSPAEPDIEPHQPSEFAIIPLDDITANPDAINDFTSMPWPDPKGSPKHDNTMNDNDSLLGGMYNSNSDNISGVPNNPFNPFLPFGSQANSGWPLNSAPANTTSNNINRINPMNMGPPSLICGPGVFNNSIIPSPGMGLLGGPPSPSNMDVVGGGSMMGPLVNGVSTSIGSGMGGSAGHNQFVGQIGSQQQYVAMANFPPVGGNFVPPINMVMPMNGPGPGMINGSLNMCGPMNGPAVNDKNRRLGSNNNRGGSSNGGGNWRTGGSNFGNDCNWRSSNNSGHLDRGNNISNRGNNWVSNNSNVCKQYLRSGNCRLGNKCKFLHPVKGGGNKNRY